MTHTNTEIVSTTHPSFSAHAELWSRLRDVIAGSDAVKAGGERYLPRLEGQTPSDYDGYRQRALFYGATNRTRAGLLGAIMRKSPEVRASDALRQELTDVTLAGDPLDAFATTQLSELLAVGRCGVLVDLAKDDDSRNRPYWVGYRAEQILNWRTTMIGGTRTLVLVVLKESVESPHPENRFATKCTEQYRVLELVNGRYQVTIWRADNRWNRFELSETITPTRQGTPLDFIPFQFFGPTSIAADIERPPLLDLVDVNLSHYRSSADLEHGRHFTALPTPWVSGMKADGAGLRIGSGVAWVPEDPSAKAGMLEFTGQGLRALETAMESKERLMAVLGARLLETQPRLQETAEAVRLRHSGDASTLATIGATMSRALTRLARWHSWWRGEKPDVVSATHIVLNRDFVDARLAPDELRSLMMLWQAGGMSFETLYANLQAGELTRAGVTARDERHAIAAADEQTDLTIDAPEDDDLAA